MIVFQNFDLLFTLQCSPFVLVVVIIRRPESVSVCPKEFDLFHYLEQRCGRIARMDFISAIKI